MKNDLLSGLKIFIKENGKDALDNIGATGSFVYTKIDSIYMDECEVLMICLALGYHKKLNKASQSERTSVKMEIAENLKNNEVLDLDLCNRTLDILEAALFEIDMPVEENKKPSVSPGEELKKISAELNREKQLNKELSSIISNKDEQIKNLIKETNQLKSNKAYNKNVIPPDEALFKEKLKKTKHGLITAILLGITGITIMGIVMYNKNKEPVYLRSQLSSLQGVNNILQSDYNTLQNRYNTLQSEHNTLQNSNSTLQNRYNTLQNRYNAVQRDYEQTKTVSRIIVTGIRFGNYSGSSTWLTNPGNRLQSSQMRILAPVITYDSTISENATFYIKIIRPDRALVTDSSSPTGFSYSSTLQINHGENRSLSLHGFGNSDRSIYPAGEYTVEIWYSNTLLRSEKLIIY